MGTGPLHAAHQSDLPGLWWMFWTIPLWIGYGMYRNNLGLVWERTLKKDDNKLLVRDRVAQGTLGICRAQGT